MTFVEEKILEEPHWRSYSRCQWLCITAIPLKAKQYQSDEHLPAEG
jgi:hypothetical protein